jgi:hypothetical protein
MAIFIGLLNQISPLQLAWLFFLLSSYTQLVPSVINTPAVINDGDSSEKGILS